MNWEDQMREDLASLRDEPGPASIRGRVMAKVERPRFAWWKWTWVPVAAAFALLMLWPTPPDIAAPPNLARTAAPPEFAYAIPVLHVVKAARPAVHEDTEFMRIFTDDPDVIILWSLESKGDIQ